MSIVPGRPIRDLDPSMMIGASIEHIKFGWFAVMVYVDNDSVISIEDRFVYTDSSGFIQDVKDAKAKATELCEMIGKKITRYESQSDGEVYIGLDDSSALRLLKLSDPESFNIATQNGVFVS